MWFESARLKTIEFCAQLFQLQIILAPSVFENSIAFRFFTFTFRFSCHDALLLEKSNVPMQKRSNIPMCILSLLFRPTLLFSPTPVPLYRLVICGIMLLVVIDGFMWMPLFLFCPKPILILSQLFQLPMDMSWSQCPCIAMDVLAWLECMIMSSEHVLLTVSSSDPIFIAKNAICFILARLVFVNLSVIDFWAVYFPRGVDSSCFGGRLLR